MTENWTRYWTLLVDLAWINVILAWVLGPDFRSLWTQQANETAADLALTLGIATIIWTLVYFAMDLDTPEWISERPGGTLVLGVAVGALTSLVAAVCYLAHHDMVLWPFGHAVAVLTCGMVASRRLIRWLLIFHAPRAPSRAVILGDGRLARELARKFARHPELRLEVIGFFCAEGKEPAAQTFPKRTSTLDIFEFLKANKVTDLMLAFPSPMPREVLPLLPQCQAGGIRISYVPQFYEMYTSQPKLLQVGGLPVLTLDPQRFSEWHPSKCRQAIGRACAGLALVTVSPLLLLAVLYLRMSRRNAFDREVRCGRNGSRFWMYRLNIPRNTEQMSWFEFVLSEASVTELPQLWNVLRGEMSLVGPRPESPDRVKHYSEWMRYRLCVTPGMTGYAQVQGLRDQHSSEAKTGFDLQYMLHRSVVADLALVLQTFWIIARRAGGALRKHSALRVNAYPRPVTEV